MRVEEATQDADTKAVLEAFEVSLSDGLRETTSFCAGVSVKREIASGLQPTDKTTEPGSPFTNSTNLGDVEDEEVRERVEDEEVRERVDSVMDTVFLQQTCQMNTIAQLTAKTPLLQEHLDERGTDEMKRTVKRKRGRPRKVVVPREEEEEEEQPRHRPRACKRATPSDADSVQDVDGMQPDEEYDPEYIPRLDEDESVRE